MKKIKCYYINLKHENNKNIHMQNLCKSLGFDYTRVEAVLGRELTDDDIMKSCSQDEANINVGRPLTKGEIGCALSHLTVLRDIVNNGIDYAVVFEDDIHTSFDRAQVSDFIDKINSNWDVILLGHHPKYTRNIGAGLSFWNQQKITKKIKIGRFSEKPLGAYAYLISLDGARKVISDFDVINKPFDWWNLDILTLRGLSEPVVKIAEQYSESSTLSLERGKVKFNRTKFQHVKDFIQKVLTRVKLKNTYFRLNRIYYQTFK